MQVRRGEVFGLLGPNGAGKSTLVKIIMTVIRPTHAVGTVLGRPVGDKPTLSRVGYLPEHHRFPRYLTGRQSLDFFGALARVPRPARRRRANELLEIVGMARDANRKVGTYSKGMMQRVGLAAAMMNDPDLILLDEPTDGVDPVGRRDIRDVLLRLRAEGKSVFINSHLLSELEMICDRVAILVNGAVATQGTLEQLALGRGWYEIGINPAQAGLVPAELRPNAVGPDGFRFDTTEPSAIQPVIDRFRAAGVALRRVQLVRPTLEDLFIEAVNQPAAPNGNGQARSPALPASAIGAAR
jgi:ABC-2 type transport system ATP-binding protein